MAALKDIDRTVVGVLAEMSHLFTNKDIGEMITVASGSSRGGATQRLLAKLGYYVIKYFQPVTPGLQVDTPSAWSWRRCHSDLRQESFRVASGTELPKLLVHTDQNLARRNSISILALILYQISRNPTHNEGIDMHREPLSGQHIRCDRASRTRSRS